MCRAAVDVQGVPTLGVVDTAADITIMNGELFRAVVATNRLKKRAFRDADKVPYTFDQRKFKLDGCIDLDIYEYTCVREGRWPGSDSGVCRQLGIVSYHPLVGTDRNQAEHKEQSGVPMVRVKLVRSVRIPPRQSVLAPVQLEQGGGCVLMEASGQLESVDFASSLVNISKGSTAQVMLTNSSGFTQKLEDGEWIGRAIEVEVIGHDPSTGGGPPLSEAAPEASDLVSESTPERVLRVGSLSAEERKYQMLAEVGPTLSWQERSKLHALLLDNHEVFAVEDGERGETDVVEMQIDTGDHPPKRQAARRVPFAARQEIAKQLHKMQDQGVIEPSYSPWASPVVLVRKKDGSLRFCIDFRHLNSVTRTNSHPSPRIDDLLDQLGKARYFSTLDLASVYWQVKVDTDSQEKTAFQPIKDSMSSTSCHLG
jgi:hypothetical protein